nr:arginase family protein [uncultured Mucilaginibacter sp.]
MNNLVVIEVPFNLGLKELTPGKPPGVDKLPEWLKQQGLYEALFPTQIINMPAPPYSMHIDAETGIRNADAIVAYAKSLAQGVQNALENNNFPLVIGGDCSILIGCLLGAKKHGKYALFFMDGHTDYVTTQFSATKAAAGMDLALVTGNGPEKITNIDGLKPYVAEANTLAFGNRCEDPEYVSLILNSGIAYFSLNDARQKGIKTVAADFIAHVKSEKLDGIWIHLDVDVLDNDVMPCVDSPHQGGLSYSELNEALTILFQSGLVSGLDITILDPDRDEKGIYAGMFVKEIAKIFNQGLNRS